MGRFLGGLHNQVAWKLTGRMPWRQEKRKWEYTLAATERAEAGFDMMEEYIRQIQNTSTQYIATRSLLDLCEASERTTGAQVGIRW